MLLLKTLRSWTFNLALIWIGVFGALVLALIGYVYWATSDYVLSQADKAIAQEQPVLHKAFDAGGRDGLVSAIDRRIADNGLDGGIYLLADSSLRPLAGNLKTWPSNLQSSGGWSTFRAPASDPDGTDRTLRATFATLADGSHLLVGRDIGHFNEFMRTINTAIILALVLIFVIAAVASISATRRTVGRIEAINATSRAIMQSGLGKRIPLRGTRDEWDQLAENLNLMLDRIESLMGEVKQVTDNVAHDLRTPLTRIRGRLETARSGAREPNSDQSLIDDVMAELDGVLRMFSSITRISQIETSDRRDAFRTVDLAEVANEVVELFDPAAEEIGSHLTRIGDQHVLVKGDRDLLFDALANLVDNAIKHGGKAGQVVLEVVEREEGVLISVADNGPGIPADERPHVLKRFYRLERSRHASGNGLGLSIVAAVAQYHGARIEMLDNLPGLRFQLRFPERTADTKV
ncbi:MAG TPA: ATP-binding protein [Xanthobacteraceae bacterium]